MSGFRQAGFKDDVPVAYQEIAGVRKGVSLSYKLEAREHADGEGSNWEGTCGRRPRLWF